ncbi:MAG: HEAT repeat domain-containing protein [Mariniblastus sp.]|nr:HEAT repeat domain-containing protein [Mariniblastus sp.]
MYNYFVAIVVSFVAIVGTVIVCSGAINYQQDPEAKGTSDLVAKLADKDDKVRVDALIELGRSSEDLPQVVPAVVGQLGELDPLVSSAASQAMVDLGAKAVPHLKPFLQSEDYRTYALGCEACRVIGEPCAVYVPLLMERLKENDQRMRGPSIGAMANFGKAALPALDQVIAGLDAEPFMTQVHACKVLVALGPDARPAGEKLVELAEKGNPSVRSWATVALGAIGPVDEYDVVEILDDKLDDFLLLDKQRALQGLALIGPAGKRALPNIERLMQDKSKSCPHDAAYAYWKVTGDADRPVAVLVELLQDVNFQNDAIEILGDMGPQAKNSVPALIEQLGSSEDYLREGAVLTLGAIGPDAKEALPALGKMKDDPDALIRSAAERSIREIEKEDP